MNFLIKKFSLIILTISFFLLIYTFYKSEIFWDGINRNYYKTYYLISSILIFFSIITFFINQRIKEYLIISCISLLASLYMFQGYLIFQENRSIEKFYEKNTQNKWDRRNKLKIYKDLKKTNDNIVVGVYPYNFLNTDYPIFPLSGISNSETILCNENGYYAIYESDRYGFNNPNEEWDNNEIEYILVGDSFALSFCINRPNDIGSTLRNLSGKSVLNLGQGGNGPLTEYATLREYLDNKVKKVLWIYFEENDSRDLESEIKNSILTKYLYNLNFSQNLIFKQKEIDNIAINIMKKETLKKRYLFKQFVDFIKFKRIRVLYFSAVPHNPPPSKEFKKILQLAKELVAKNNSKLYFVYLPEYNRFTTNYENKNYDLVKNIVTELNIHFIDIKEVFEKEANPLKLFAFKNIHYNIEGYRKVAKTIYKFTKD